jgi:F0F1-type ATP synthase membrane subunit b/b'
MNKKLSFFFFILVLSLEALASGDGHGGGHGGHVPTAKDLIAPAFNFIVLFGFLLFKIKKPLKQHFEMKAKKVSEVLDRAQVKSKEAQVLFDLNTKKMKEVDQEVANIQKSAEEDARKFALDCEKEAKDKTEKIKNEAIGRVEAEKRALINQLNKELVDDVILKSKKMITTDSNIKKDLTTKVVKEINQ